VTFLSPQKEKSLDPLKIKAFLLAEKEGKWKFVLMYQGKITFCVHSRVKNSQNSC